MRSRRQQRTLGAALLLQQLLCGHEPASGQERDLRALFPRQAEITTEAVSGLVRLPLPEEVLAACRADLSDLRLLDERGAETPYTLLSAKLLPGRLEESRSVPARILDVARERSGSRPRLWQERFRLAVPEAPPADGSWDLVIESDTAVFVRRVAVAAVSGGERRDPLVGEGSVFRLASGAERRAIPLPATGARVIEVTLSGQEGGYLEPGFRFESSRALPLADRIEVPLARLSIRSRGGRTTIEVERPLGVVPEAIRIDTTTPAFQRSVVVRDLGGAATGGRIGAGRVLRLATGGELGITVEERRVPITRSEGSRLVVEIDDGDSPPLEEPTVVAVMGRPSIVFAAPAVPLRLYFGGGRARRPRYDLAAFASTPPVAGPAAVTVAALLDLQPNAELAPSEENPAWDRAPPLVFAMRAGARLDARVYSHRRSLSVPDGAEAPLRISLGPETLWVLRADTADLRIVDEEARQWPFVRRSSPPVELALGSERESDEGRSTYRFRLPAAPVTLVGLLLEIDAEFFDRAYTVRSVAAEAEGRARAEPRPIRTGRLVRQAGDPGIVHIELGPQRVSRLELVVEDGDDGPLELAGARGSFETLELDLVAPPGEYRLLLGYPSDRRPVYELERSRGLVLALAGTAVRPGPLEENPELTASARKGSGGQSERLLWAALVLAVVVLSVLTLRLARSQRGESDQE